MCVFKYDDIFQGNVCEMIPRQIKATCISKYCSKRHCSKLCENLFPNAVRKKKLK